MKKLLIAVLSLASLATYAESSLRCVPKITTGPAMYEEGKAVMLSPGQAEATVELKSYLVKLNLQNLNSDLDSMLNYEFGAELFRKDASNRPKQIHRINLSVPSLQGHFVLNAGTLEDVIFIVSCFKH